MLFLRENSQVRVPTVYAIFRHNETNYLVMEFLEGGELSEKRWFALDDDARTKILSRLCEQYRLLRSIPPPSPEYYGRVHHQGWGPLSQIFIHRTDRMVGPFDSIRDFLSETVYSMLVTAVTGSLLPEFTCNELEHIAHYESTLATCSGTKPIFTHSDPSLHNIIARPIRDGQDWEVTLIDWAWCGWYPAYMQTVFLHAYIGLRRPINEIVEESDDKVMTKIQQFYASIGELDVEATDHFLGTIERSFEELYSEQLKLIKEMPIGTQPLLM
jgi:serine/threonine protein kinase